MKDKVRDYLPPDEPATRKNPLYRNLFDGFDKIDGKPTEAERRVGLEHALLKKLSHINFTSHSNSLCVASNVFVLFVREKKLEPNIRWRRVSQN